MAKSFIRYIIILLLQCSQLLGSTVPTPVLKWRNGGFSLVQFNKGYYTSPATLDVNNDGIKDIIYANYKVFAFDGKTGNMLWGFWAGTDRSGPDIYNGIGTFCSVVIADINGDNQEEIITVHTNGMVCIYDKNGYFLPGFPTQPTGKNDTIASLSVYDLDNDGDMEIIIGWAIQNNLNSCVIEHDGNVRLGWPQYVPNEYANALGIYNDNIAVGDVNNDGFGEIFVPSDTGKTCAYYMDGSPLPVNPIFSENVDFEKKWPHVINYENYYYEKLHYSPTENFYMGTDSPITIADVDNDGIYEIVIVGSVFTNPPDQSLYTKPFIYNIDRTRYNKNNFNWEDNLPQSGAPLRNDSRVIARKTTNPVVADIDGDGYKEILSSSFDGKLHCYWLDKTERYSWPFSVYIPNEGVMRFSSEPVVVDLDNDGELEVIFTSWPHYYSNAGGHLFILSPRGELIHQTALPYGDNGDVGELEFDGGLAAPTIDDVDGDGELEIIIGTVYAGLLVYDLPGAKGGAMPWPTGRHDYARTGCIEMPTKKDNLICTWSDDGTYWKHSETGYWLPLASAASQITAGDLDGDGIDDLIGIWLSQGGVWAKYSSSQQWKLLSSTADWISSGDMNGDGRVDLVGTWSSQGVYYKNSVNGAWVLMASPATKITTGDLDGDGIDDLIGIWPSQGGVWAKYSSAQWKLEASTADWIAAGKMDSSNAPAYITAPINLERLLRQPDLSKNNYVDLSNQGPGGVNFKYTMEKNTQVGSRRSKIRLR